MTYRNRRLLDLAHSAPCMATFSHECNDYLGCEPAHSDSHVFGRGAGHKSNDWAVAFICHNAHKVITAKVGDDLTREQKFYDWLRAFVRTQTYLWETQKVKVA
jgi:hypothetical protein